MNGSLGESKDEEGIAPDVPSGSSAAGTSTEIVDAETRITEASALEESSAIDGGDNFKQEIGDEVALLGRTVAGPWKRYFARQLDYVAPSLAAILLAFTFDSTTFLWLTLLGILPLLLWIIPEAVLLAYVGNTPGKWLMGLGLATSDGSRPLLDKTLRRSVSVVVKGMAVNIPIANLFAPFRAYLQLENHGITSWDKATGFQVVERRRVGAFQVSAVLAVTTVLTFAGTWLMSTSPVGNGSARARAEADQRMDTLRDSAALWMADEGVELTPVGEPHTPMIAAGTVVSHTLALEAGEGRLILATCDDDCVDLDLAVLGPDGAIMAEDLEPDAEPAALFVAPFAGDFTVELSMLSCMTENCLAQLELHDIAGFEFEQSGSCFVVSEEGDALTANHVIEGASTITVTLGDGRTKVAELTEALPEDDVALIHMDAQTPEFLRVSAARLRLGDPVMTLGFPATEILGSDAKFSEGTIASLSGPGGDRNLFQISAQIQPGSSGGPVLDPDGAVIGLVTSMAAEIAFYEQTGSLPQGINWATRASRFSDLVPDVMKRSAASRSSDRSRVIEKSRRAVCRVEALIRAREPVEAVATSTMSVR